MPSSSQGSVPADEAMLAGFQRRSRAPWVDDDDLPPRPLMRRSGPRISGAVSRLPLETSWLA